MAPLKVVHYLNQFFGGKGGEEFSSSPCEIVEGPVGASRRLQMFSPEAYQIVRTVICGDTYFIENPEEVTQQVKDLCESVRADVLVAGPSFDAGRYGMACARVCSEVTELLSLPAITGSYCENPGRDACSRKVYVVETKETASDMENALRQISKLLLKLSRNEELGPAIVDGYFPRGVRRNIRTGLTAAHRAVDMLAQRLSGTEVQSEIHPPPRPEPKTLANLPVQLSEATIALVTESGMVPRGNPDRIESQRATRWASYSIAGYSTLPPLEYEAIHSGYNTFWVNKNPNRVVPVDAMRSLEREGSYGKLLDRYYVTSGTGGSVRAMERIGREIAQDLTKQNTHGVILTAT
jgi:glycine reductase complex component B subunit gamma